jgi:putative ABC transport system permease protein
MRAGKAAGENRVTSGGETEDNVDRAYVRRALGAQRIDVVRMVVRQGTGIALAGIGIGVVSSVGLTRVMSSLLYEVQPTDPQTFVVVTVAFATVALVACLR